MSAIGATRVPHPRQYSPKEDPKRPRQTCVGRSIELRYSARPAHIRHRALLPSFFAPPLPVTNLIQLLSTPYPHYSLAVYMTSPATTRRPFTGQSRFDSASGQSRPWTGQSRPTTARPATATTVRHEGAYIVAVLEGRGVSREVGLAALDRDTGKVMLVQVRRGTLSVCCSMN